jgi:hypothetical protein
MEAKRVRIFALLCRANSDMRCYPLHQMFRVAQLRHKLKSPEPQAYDSDLASGADDALVYNAGS